MVSSWVARWVQMVRPAGAILDVACGTGRHTQFFSERNFSVTALDISSTALKTVATHSPSAKIVQADIENAPWPLQINGVPQTFDAVVVTNYLWRPLMPVLQASLNSGGVLIYETFAQGNEAVGKPSRPDFLLHRGELLSLFQGLQVIAFEDGFMSAPDRFVQRLAAVNGAAKMTHLSESFSPPRFYL